MSQENEKTQITDSVDSAVGNAADAGRTVYDSQRKNTGGKAVRNGREKSGKASPGTQSDKPSSTPKSAEGVSGASNGASTGASTAETGGGAAGGTAASSGTGASVGGATGGTTAAGGAAAGTSTGAAAGSFAGPVGTAAGAAAGGLLAFGGKIIKFLIFAVILFLMIIGAIIEELVPNVIAKPVATATSLAKGIYEQVKNVFRGLLDFFTGGGSSAETEMIKDFNDATIYAVGVIDDILESAYADAEEELRKECEEKGYDFETTLDSSMSERNLFTATDYAFIISTYSVTTDFMNMTVADFKEQLREHLKITYNIETEEQTKEEWDPVPIYYYEGPTEVSYIKEYKTVTHTDSKGNTYSEEVPVYATAQVYEKTTTVDKREDGTGYWISNREGENVTNYVDAMLLEHDSDSDDVLKGKYILGPVVGKPAEVLVKPEIKTVTYGEVTLSAYKNEDVYRMFDVDPEAPYVEGYDEPTNRKMIEMRQRMCEQAVNAVLATSHVVYATDGLSELEIQEYLDGLPAGTSGNRKQVIKTALSLVGMVPYYYGGKPSHTGWDDSWWSTVSPDHKGRTKKGLDCSGYVQWVFATAGFNGGNLDNRLLSTGSISNLQYITKDELQPGDIGLKYQGDSKHTGIYMGNDTWIHCSSSGTVVVAPGYSGFPLYKRYMPSVMEGDDLYSDAIETYSKASSWDYPQDQWYLISQCVFQECADNGEGTIAVGECIRNRVISPDFPNDPYSVITQKGQFESYGAGHYKTRRPTADQIEFVKQTIGGTKSIMNNPNVLFFVSESYHKKNFLTGKSWLKKAGYRVFGNYGGNVYYIK